MKHIISFLLITIFTITAAPARAAKDLDDIKLLAQKEFRLLSEDLAAVIAYRAISPAEPLGLTGFDIGVEATYSQLANGSEWVKAVSSGNTVDAVVAPKIHLIKGLPWNIDVGAFYAGVPDSNIGFAGAELRVALLEGSTTSPALALRGTYSQLFGVDELALDTYGAELSISKGFAMFTPYAGAGYLWASSRPQGLAKDLLEKEDYGMSRYYVGVNMNLAVINIAVEGDRTGEVSSYSLKLGWRW